MDKQEELKNKQRRIYQSIVDDYQRKITAFEHRFDNLVENKPEVLDQPLTDEEKEYLSNYYWMRLFKKKKDDV